MRAETLIPSKNTHCSSSSHPNPKLSNEIHDEHSIRQQSGKNSRHQRPPRCRTHPEPSGSRSHYPARAAGCLVPIPLQEYQTPEKIRTTIKQLQAQGRELEVANPEPLVACQKAHKGKKKATERAISRSPQGSRTMFERLESSRQLDFESDSESITKAPIKAQPEKRVPAP